MSSLELPEPDLFGAAPGMPPGLSYQPDFISAAEEAALLAAIAELPFTEAKYQQYTARRRIMSYGSSYDFGQRALKPAPPLPEFLAPLREKTAAWAGVAPEDFVHGLINEYRPGTPLGWHRDTPEFGVVAGVSLAGLARMRWRPYPPAKGQKSVLLEVAPRSAYIMRGEARWKWQHSVSPTKGLRYSITFRTLRSSAA